MKVMQIYEEDITGQLGRQVLQIDGEDPDFQTWMQP